MLIYYLFCLASVSSPCRCSFGRVSISLRVYVIQLLVLHVNQSDHADASDLAKQCTQNLPPPTGRYVCILDRQTLDTVLDTTLDTPSTRADTVALTPWTLRSQQRPINPSPLSPDPADSPSLLALLLDVWEDGSDSL